MCGLAGYIDLRAQTGADRLAATAVAMAGALHHRGPDDSGCWVDPSAGVALGFRRLSIIDLSPEGHQPMRSAGGRYVIVFNGEIYNFEAVRSELQALPGSMKPVFRGHSDTEVMLAAFEAWGIEDAVRRFNGMFAFAVWDRQERTLTLARDRMGEKPLYYGWMGSTFLFGSELKALRRHPEFVGEIDRNALALYLRHSCVPTPYSIYQKIAKLPPGTMLTLAVDAKSRPEPRAYWSLKETAERGLADPITGSPEDAIEELDTLLRDAIRLRMVADVPLGALLSGGIDSSTVVAMMQAQSSRSVKTYSIGFEETAYSEASDARAVAAHLGTDHTEQIVTASEALGVIPKLPQLYDEPFADSSQIPTYLVSALARKHVTVGLSGDGGDELFAGYLRHFLGRGLWKRSRRIPSPLRSATARALTVFKPSQWDAVYRAASPLLPPALRQRNPADKLHKLASLFSSADTGTLYRDLVSHWNCPESLVAGAEELPTHISDPSRWAKLTDFTDQMMYLDGVSYLPDDILAKVDRASMGVSLEARVPMLDHRLVEFAWRIPLSMKVRDGQGKWLLRQVLDRYVPRPLVERPKMGFDVPVGEWLRGPLRDWAESLLTPERLSAGGILSSRPIRQKWEEHIAGKHNWQLLLWDVLMYQAWAAEADRPIDGQSDGER